MRLSLHDDHPERPNDPSLGRPQDFPRRVDARIRAVSYEVLIPAGIMLLLGLLMAAIYALFR